MPKLKLFDYYQSMRKQKLTIILQTIKNNTNIKTEDLLAKLHVNPPFITKDKALEFLEDLKKVGKIKITKKGEVSLCH